LLASAIEAGRGRRPARPWVMGTTPPSTRACPRA